jgi:hypothetical protein
LIRLGFSLPSEINVKKLLLSSVVCSLLCAAVSAQDHGHLNVGASGEKLTWDNGSMFAPPYVKTLLFTNSGQFANIYSGNITLTALHSTNPFGEIDPAAPKLGAYIVAEIVSVQGPIGGAFAFWETNSTTSPAVSIPTGTTNSTFRFDLSQRALGAGVPGGDAFGHIHGRRFSVSTPGLYSVGFRASDISTNGPNGGPIHSPSDVLHFYFQGGVSITHLEPDVDHSHITFGAMAGYSWQVQTTTDLNNPNWLNVPDAVTGNDTLMEIEDDHAVIGNRFYRVFGIVIPP